MNRRARVYAWAGAMLLGLCTLGRAAGPLDERVPADALVYVGWAGADGLAPQYANSNLKGILDASAVQSFVGEHVVKLIEEWKANPNLVGPDGVKIVEKLQAGLPILWHHPGAFYCSPPDLSNPQMPVLHLGFICDAGTDAKALTDLIKAMLAQTPPPREMPMHLLQDGNVLVVAFGKDQSVDDMKKGGGLAAAPAYKAAMNNVRQANPAIAFYIDMNRIVSTVKEGLAKTSAPPEVREKFPIVSDTLGISSLTQVAVTSGFDGKGWSDRAFIGINGPRNGLLSLLDGAPLSDGALAIVPKDASAFSIWKLDLPKVYAQTRAVIGKVDAQSLKDFDAGVVEGGKAMGLDIEKELIAPLGDEWVLYRAPLSEDGNSFALVHKLRDGETFAKTLATVEKFYNEQIGGVAGGGMAMFRAEKMTTSKIPVSTIALGGASVAWTARNGYLYISSMEGIAGAVKQVENKLPSIVENDLYKAARAALPTSARPLAISYANPAKLYPEIRRLALGYLPILRAMGVDVPRELFPDAEDVTKFMTPGANIMWSEADGIHCAGNSAFPGATALSGQQVGPIVVAALAGSGLMWAGRSTEMRVESSRSVDMANLRGITQSSMVYASDHKDQMPDDLARLVADGMLSPRQLTSRRAGTEAMVLTPELQKMAKEDFAKFAEQVAQHTDFIYIGKGTKMDADAAIILAYEKPSTQTKDGLAVAFRDGHVEFLGWDALQQVFKPTSEYLKKNGQAEVDVKDLMKKAGVLEGGIP